MSTLAPADRSRRLGLGGFGLPGIMARQDFFGQTAFVIAVQAILLLVAVSIDLARYFDQVTAAAGAVGTVGRMLLLAHYLGLRIVDMVTRLLPIAVFVGVLLFELWSVLTRRRAIHWVAGRHPLRVLFPTLAVGLMFGALQYPLDVAWRPAAVLRQASERLGAYGERYDRERIRKDVWFVADDRVVHADVRYGPPAELIDVDLFLLDGDGRIREAIRAARARPTELAQVWRFERSTRWSRDPERPAAMRVETGAIERLVRIPLHPLAVTYLGLPAKYVPDDDLRTMVASGSGMLIGAEHRVWLEVRRADALLPPAMALVAAMVSLFAGAGRPSLAVMIGCVSAGYAVHVATRVFVAAGELERLDPFAAAWTPVLVAFAAVPVLAAIGALRRWRA
ncbi:MAG: LptF/LptG family permease [Phyllobacteriaceae bacterium]|nr:LptF/LptG family permease [Phyllobacteriaceae bacterium]